MKSKLFLSLVLILVKLRPFHAYVQRSQGVESPNVQQWENYYYQNHQTPYKSQTSSNQFSTNRRPLDHRQNHQEKTELEYWESNSVDSSSATDNGGIIEYLLRLFKAVSALGADTKRGSAENAESRLFNDQLGIVTDTIGGAVTQVGFGKQAIFKQIEAVLPMPARALLDSNIKRTAANSLEYMRIAMQGYINIVRGVRDIFRVAYYSAVFIGDPANFDLIKAINDFGYQNKIPE
jgi:hypothetical protein